MQSLPHAAHGGRKRGRGSRQQPLDLMCVTHTPSCSRAWYLNLLSLNRLAKLVFKCMLMQVDSCEGWRSHTEPCKVVPLFAAKNDISQVPAGLRATPPLDGSSPFPDRSSDFTTNKSARTTSATTPSSGPPELGAPVVADQTTLSKALAGEAVVLIGGAEAGHNGAVTLPPKVPPADVGDMLALQGVLTLPPLAADTTDPTILAARLQLNPTGPEQLNEGLFHYLITRPWVTDTIDGVQYFCAEQVSTALGEEHKAACCRQQVTVLQAAFDHESQYLAMLLHGTAQQRARDGYTLSSDFPSAAERVSALVQHIVNSEPADLLQDHSHQSLAHALGMSQASMPPALGVALQRLRERHFQLRAAQLAAQAVAADAKVYRDAASQIVYQSHGLMCLLTLTENSTWDPMRDVPRLQHARQQLQSQEQVWGLLSALQDSQCWWATPAAHAAVAEGYPSFLRQCVRLAVRTAMQTREAQADALRQRISLIASSCLQSAEQLGRVMSQQEYCAATRLLPPPPPLPTILNAALHDMHALNPFIPLVTDAPPSHPFAPTSTAEALGLATTRSAAAAALNLPPIRSQAQSSSSAAVHVATSAGAAAAKTHPSSAQEHDDHEGMAAASLSTMQAGADEDDVAVEDSLPPDILALIEQEMKGLAPPLSYDEQKGILTLAARQGGEHKLLANGVPPPQAYPPSALDCVPWNSGPTRGGGSRAPAGSEEQRSYDKLSYPEPTAPGITVEDVREWIHTLLHACGVPESAWDLHCACLALTVQRTLVASDLLRQAHAAKVASDELRDLPLAAITPTSWRGILLGASLAWVGPTPDRHSIEALLPSGEQRSSRPAIAAAQAAITGGGGSREPPLEMDGTVPQVPLLPALRLTGDGSTLAWPAHWQGTRWQQLVSSRTALASPLPAYREWVLQLCSACPRLLAAHQRAGGLRSMGRLPVDAPWQVAGSGVRASSFDADTAALDDGSGDTNAMPARELGQVLEQLSAETEEERS